MVKYPVVLLILIFVILSLLGSCKKENEINQEVLKDPNVIKVEKSTIKINEKSSAALKEKYPELMKKDFASKNIKIKSTSPPPPGGGPHGTIEQDFKYPANWPSGLKAYKGSIITDWNVSNTDARLVYVASVDQTTVEKYIEATMKANGYKNSVKTPGKFLSIWEYNKSSAYMRYIIKLDPTSKAIEVDATWVNNTSAK